MKQVKLIRTSRLIKLISMKDLMWLPLKSKTQKLMTLVKLDAINLSET